MSDLPFEIYKLDGTGNIFLAVDARAGSSFRKWEKNTSLRSELARALCPFRALGADGLIFFSEGAGTNSLRWDFYNADGSGAEMCGNAARCAGLFAKEILGVQSFPLSLETVAGEVLISPRADSRWSVRMPAIKAAVVEKKPIVNGREWPGLFVNTGVPHFVIPPPEGDESRQREIARALRKHSDFGSSGTNVTILSGTQAKSFERGVEDFTAACGTGAVAAAVAMKQQGAPGPYQVLMPGGELEVHLGEVQPVLIGPAVLVAKIQTNREILK